MNTNSYLEQADRIGARICRDAIWGGGRCNWVAGYGTEDEEVFQSLDASLYSGTSGIALFLGRLFRVSGEKIFRDTANGALRQALSLKDRMQAANDFGFYAGLAGVVYAMVEAGDPWISQGMELAHVLLPPMALPECDVMAGRAGILASALYFHRVGGEAAFLDAAIRQGDALLEVARRTGAGWSWPTLENLAQPGRPDLTGFAHGAGGVAWSLLELWNATGEQKYRIAAEEGFRYEQSCFRAEHGNWPDFRECTAEETEPEFLTVWCHGAGGIAFSRLRAAQLTGNPQYQHQAGVALAAVEALLPDGWGTCCLCHGAFGAIDLLLHVERITQAHAAARHAMDQYPLRRMSWPCGGAEGHETPDLMLGLAGIGHTFLRLSDPASFPTPLII